MATVLEALQNAQINVKQLPKTGLFTLPLIQSQLENAITLLEKGYDIEEDIEEIIDQHGSLEDVPTLVL